jgi:type II secretory pathway predicted ATPase ExeA
VTLQLCRNRTFQLCGYRLGEQNNDYVETTRDDRLNALVDKLCNNAMAAFFGRAEKRRALFVVGESDSGKTRALKYMIANRAEFKPVQTSRGEVATFLSWEAPKPLTLKGFALAGLAALRYQVVLTKEMTEQKLFNILKAQIKEKRVMFMWIDELQHVLKGSTTAELQNVSDIIKSLLQIPGWPLHMILSGVPTLARFLTRQDDGQLRNRSNLLHFRPITDTNSELMLQLQELIMEKAGVAVAETNTPEFIERLTYSCSGALGTMIKRMQAAATEAIVEAKMSVSQTPPALEKANIIITLAHYATVYELETGASDEVNLFLQDAWRTISPLAPLHDILEEVPDAPEDKRTLKKKKTK